jgi:hypothetical protein
VVGDLVYGSASFVAVDKGGAAYVALGGFEVLDAPRAETQAFGDLTDREEAVARDIVSPVEFFLTGQRHVPPHMYPGAILIGRMK